MGKQTRILFIIKPPASEQKTDSFSTNILQISASEFSALADPMIDEKLLFPPAEKLI